MQLFTCNTSNETCQFPHIKLTRWAKCSPQIKCDARVSVDAKPHIVVRVIKWHTVGKHDQIRGCLAATFVRSGFSSCITLYILGRRGVRGCANSLMLEREFTQPNRVFWSRQGGFFEHLPRSQYTVREALRREIIFLVAIQLHVEVIWDGIRRHVFRTFSERVFFLCTNVWSSHHGCRRKS